MPPKYSQLNKSLRKVKILRIKKTEQPSLLSEYFYRALGVLFLALFLLLMGFKYRWDEAGVIALWVVGILFVTRQVWRFAKGDTSAPPEKEKKKVVLAEPVKQYKAPEAPRVSKDFSHRPPAGDKRYPPPSPFIRPPK